MLAPARVFVVSCSHSTHTGACLEESGKGCGPCTNKAIFCDYCEGSGGYEQCTEDTTFNTNACPGWIDSFSCESDDF